jgi:capsular exopolysaccharide synthesis family protein
VDEAILHPLDPDLERLGESSATEPVPITTISEGDSTNTASLTGGASPSDVLSCCHETIWTPDAESVLFWEGKEQGRGMEEFRALRSRLYRLRREQPFKSLLVTSALPKEGRSFVAANLAQVMALQPECRVLLIDADLRNPRLHFLFGTFAVPGFSDYLLQETDEFSIMQKGCEESLFLIPSGRSVPRPTELISNGRLKSLLARVEPLFDWIIIDAPAAIPVSDACIVAHSCDGVLLVVRSSSTPFDVVRQARAKFRDESLLGVVLNEINADSSSDLG